MQVELDTYLDRRTAYMFGVTASGVRLDHFHPNHNEDDADAQFDPVWEAKTAIGEDGWTAELWLPFSQLRFNDAPERVFGLNIKRWRPDLNEEDYWVVIGRTQRGWASRFGDLHEQSRACIPGPVLKCCRMLPVRRSPTPTATATARSIRP